MKTYDLYGTSSLSMTQLRDKLTELLELSFQERDSGYRGGVYYRTGDLRHEHFVILSNEGEDEDELQAPDFPDKHVLLQVNATVRPESLREILATLPDLSLLRSRTIQ